MLDAGFPELNSFFDGRHAEPAYARLHKGPGDRHRSMPIGIRLDDGQNLALFTDASSGLKEIMEQIAEVDSSGGGWRGQ